MSRQHDSHTFDMFGDAASAHPALGSTPELLALCERWVARGWLRDLDRALVRFLASEARDAPTLLLLAVRAKPAPTQRRTPGSHRHRLRKHGHRKPRWEANSLGDG